MHDTLIDRIATGAGSAEDLRQFARASEAGEPGAEWETLAAALQAEFALVRGTRAAVDAAGRIEPPVVSVVAPSPWRLAVASSGWIAAVLALALLGWIAAGIPALDTDGTAERGAAVRPAGFASVDDALEQYIRAGRASGRIVRELPPETLDVRPAGDGVAAEVLYVRRLLERVEVDTAYRLAADEYGRATYLPTTHAAPPRRDSM